MADRAPLAVVIDDEQDVRTTIELGLRNSGWQVESAADGRTGLEMIRQGMPRLVVLDLMMSGMSGLEFCKKLLTQPGGGEVAVLLISGISEKASLLQDFWQLPLKRKDFLRKPFSITALLDHVHRLLPEIKMAVSAAPDAEQKTAGTAARISPGPVTSGPPTPPSWLQSVPMTPARSQPTEPARPKQPAPPPQAPARGSSAGVEEQAHKTGYRILIIDDEPDIRMILESALSMFHTTATAENGMEGLKALDAFLPDFVLSDINMPVLNGLETAEAIRRHPVMSRVPIFFLTAERGAEVPRKAYDVGGNLFLRKPVDPFRLLNYIDFFLNETSLQPEFYWKQRGHKGAQPQESGKKTGAPAKADTSTTAAGAIRILTVDFNIENHKLLKRLLGESGEASKVPGGPFETLWTEDSRTALGNMARWQPDIILYNPRNPGYDGVAFGQTLKLQKVMDQMIVLIGARFYDADLQYAERVLKTPTIDITSPEETVIHKLRKVIEGAAQRIKPKDFSLARLQAEQAERQRELQKASAKTARERETFRQRYTKIQEFIDQNYSG